MTVDPRTPVLVGVGTADVGADAGSRDGLGVEAAELMALALEAAGRDAGAPSLLAAVDRIAVPQGTWSYPDPARLVADRLGIPAARTYFGQLGVPQQTLINQALRAISAGHCDVAVVLGGEARARARRAAKAGALAPETAQPGVVPDVVFDREEDFMAPAEIQAGLVQPVLQYALIENALAAAEGLDIEAQGAEVAALWERFNLVARSNPAAAFPAPLSATALATPSAQNRPLAFPYNKWHASQWTVDQAAALLFCSAETARAHRVPLDRWLFPLVGLDASHALSLSQRRHLHRWPAMAVLGRAATERIGRPLDQVDHIELYSCFPSAVRVQQRELGLLSRPTPTVTGGMAFAGGPFNNFVYQATAAMAPLLRQEPAALGLLSTVCGLLTKPGLALWSATPDSDPPLIADLAEPAARASAALTVTDDHRGPARVASCTVNYRGLEPATTFVLADIDPDHRAVATSDDLALADAVRAGTLIGTELILNAGRIEC